MDALDKVVFEGQIQVVALVDDAGDIAYFVKVDALQKVTVLHHRIVDFVTYNKHCCGYVQFFDGDFGCQQWTIQIVVVKVVLGNCHFLWDKVTNCVGSEICAENLVEALVVHGYFVTNQALWFGVFGIVGMHHKSAICNIGGDFFVFDTKRNVVRPSNRLQRLGFVVRYKVGIEGPAKHNMPQIISD